MKLAILGATGSIGENTLKLAEAFPDKIEITALSCAYKVERLARLIRRHRPKVVAVYGPKERDCLCETLKEAGSTALPEILIGPQGQAAVAAESGAEVVVSAIVGAAGLWPTVAAVKAGLKIALANKESLVIGGDLIIPEASARHSEINPVDSEHSAIFQILRGLRGRGVRRLILTASGGPFKGYKTEDLAEVTREDALRHPSWSMGPKISCDSATMMNKGFEMIEAHHLFNLPYHQLETVVHPQSVIHSIVEYVDGAQLMQAGPADMRLAIAYALSHPERWPLLTQTDPAPYEPLDLPRLGYEQWSGHLTFEEPDYETFKCLKLAIQAGRSGGSAPAILCGANDEAVDLFLLGAIKFLDIPDLVEQALNRLPSGPLTSVEQALEVVNESRRLVKALALS